MSGSRRGLLRAGGGGTFRNTPEQDAEDAQEDEKVVEDDADDNQVGDAPSSRSRRWLADCGANGHQAEFQGLEHHEQLGRLREIWHSLWEEEQNGGERSSSSGPGKGAEEEAWAAAGGESTMPGRSADHRS
jgi:hypothetical protein